MIFPPLHPTPHMHDMALQPYHIKQVKKMNSKNELYWADKERIRRAEEIRRNKKKEVK